MGVEKGEVVVKLPKCPPTPPPPPPRPRWSISSYTRREIEKFWRKKRLEEEEHFLAAIKSAARLRASHLSEEGYVVFLESLEENKTKDEDVSIITQKIKSCEDYDQEIRVGIKDWWTKSKYAYLNQPAIGSVGRQRRRSNYKPESIWFHNMSFSIATASA
ncbi:Nudix hydrolase 8 [Bienertia sinuspersici]